MFTYVAALVSWQKTPISKLGVVDVRLLRCGNA
jgi:hypothetical protein